MQTVVVTSKSDVNSVNDNTVHAALAHGFTIFILVTALGHISQGSYCQQISESNTKRPNIVRHF
uniref:Transposase n=1 Tax=Heterorhabditis bacteriophora TaxID=37862 RepID=A0A1I7XPL5_HETBA